MQRKILYILIILCGIATLVSGYSLVESRKAYKVKKYWVESQSPGIQPSQISSTSNHESTITKIPTEQKTITSKPTDTSETNLEEKFETNVSLKINGNTFTIPYIEKMTAEDTMKYAHETHPQQFWYESIAYGSDLGTFVTSINGTAENYKEKMHWILYINGKKSNKGISTLILNPNDTITWNYEKEIL